MHISKQQLRRSVPKRLNLFGHGCQLPGDDPTEPEVSNFDKSIFVDQDILRFEVPMEHLFRVHVAHSFEYLPHNVLL